MTLSYEDIENRVSQKGWTLSNVDLSSDLTLTCNKGHHFIVSKSQVSSVKPCSYCKGIKVTPQELIKEAKSLGFNIKQEDIKQVKKDRSGNSFVPKSTRLVFTCLEGHTQTMSINDLERGKQCSLCNHTRANSAFSRSEEVIARVLEYNKIYFIRQYATDAKHEQLKLDFILPDNKVIIEYDGSHHKYGRTTDRGDNLAEIQRKDCIRDAYAESIGFRMVRINHHQVGRKLIYSLAKELPELHLNPSRPEYDEVVRDVYDYASMHFGWDSYEKIKSFADIYKSVGRVEAHKRTGRSMSNLQRDYNTIYGIPKK
ncbi:hypothetical protein FGBNBECL_00022 [Enterococcus phage vB_OCPT_Bob]|uniref:DUF559 domain-containing protein n=1 Tax=Enterococcus phage vB_OCPT_Bob TaxID=2922318 RepID=A0A9E7DU14_9CAUD|nr:hypothetical protein FGBNBECL_00022 [Enterococcus phage vB_OCPT_Bob]